jgi:hypothetical protein
VRTAVVGDEDGNCRGEVNTSAEVSSVAFSLLWGPGSDWVVLISGEAFQLDLDSRNAGSAPVA